MSAAGITLILLSSLAYGQSLPVSVPGNVKMEVEVTFHGFRDAGEYERIDQTAVKVDLRLRSKKDAQIPHSNLNFAAPRQPIEGSYSAALANTGETLHFSAELEPDWLDPQSDFTVTVRTEMPEKVDRSKLILAKKSALSKMGSAIFGSSGPPGETSSHFPIDIHKGVQTKDFDGLTITIRLEDDLSTDSLIQADLVEVVRNIDELEAENARLFAASLTAREEEVRFNRDKMAGNLNRLYKLRHITNHVAKEDLAKAKAAAALPQNSEAVLRRSANELGQAWDFQSLLRKLHEIGPDQSLELINTMSSRLDGLNSQLADLQRQLQANNDEIVHLNIRNYTEALLASGAVGGWGFGISLSAADALNKFTGRSQSATWKTKGHLLMAAVVLTGLSYTMHAETTRRFDLNQEEVTKLLHEIDRLQPQVVYERNLLAFARKILEQEKKIPEARKPSSENAPVPVTSNIHQQAVEIGKIETFDKLMTQLRSMDPNEARKLVDEMAFDLDTLKLQLKVMNLSLRDNRKAQVSISARMVLEGAMAVVGFGGVGVSALDWLLVNAGGSPPLIAPKGKLVVAALAVLATSYCMTKDTNKFIKLNPDETVKLAGIVNDLNKEITYERNLLEYLRKTFLAEANVSGAGQ